VTDLPRPAERSVAPVADRALLLLAFAEDAARTVLARVLFFSIEGWLFYSSLYADWLGWFGDLHVPFFEALARIERWLKLDTESKLYLMLLSPVVLVWLYRCLWRAIGGTSPGLRRWGFTPESSGVAGIALKMLPGVLFVTPPRRAAAPVALTNEHWSRWWPIALVTGVAWLLDWTFAMGRGH
jgi:hypothetical protein